MKRVYEMDDVEIDELVEGYHREVALGPKDLAEELALLFNRDVR